MTTISGTDYATLTRYGLDDQPDMDTAEYRMERPDGYEVYAGEWFTTVEHHQAPDGRTYHVLVTGTFASDHSPGSSHYTDYTLYDCDDPEEVSAFRRDTQEWESKPETDPDFDEDEDDPLHESTD